MADLLRLLIACLACTVSGAIAAVLIPYARAAWRAPRGGRLLPIHVALVSTGVLGLVVGNGTGVYQRVGTGAPLTWQLWLYLGSMVILLVAIVMIGAHMRRRYRGDRSCGKHGRPE